MEAGKMKHPQFEALLFDIDHLGHEERIALEAHLRECEHCNVLATSWSDLEGKMLSAPQMEPATGFTDRFRERLVVYKRRKQERLTLSVILAILISLIIVTGFFGAELLTLVPSGISFLLKSINGLVRLGGLLTILRDFALVIIEGIAQSLSAGLLLAISAAASGLAIIWVFSIYKFGFNTIRRE
jgi:predicted anti-sigma-YlaC factor YlaD